MQYNFPPPPPPLGTNFVQGIACKLSKGVIDEDGSSSTPYNMFVDDGILVDRPKVALSGSIEALYIILGSSDREARQDTLSFDKFYASIFSYCHDSVRQRDTYTDNDYVYDRGKISQLFGFILPLAQGQKKFLYHTRRKIPRISIKLSRNIVMGLFPLSYSPHFSK